MPRGKISNIEIQRKKPVLIIKQTIWNKSMQSQVNWPKSTEWLTTHIEITISSRT